MNAIKDASSWAVVALIEIERKTSEISLSDFPQNIKGLLDFDFMPSLRCPARIILLKKARSNIFVTEVLGYPNSDL